MSSIEQLQQMIADAKRMAVFTGAGISAESGIPTYRGDDGVWHKYDPAKYANINYFFKEPEYYWRFFQEERYPVLKQAAPNRGTFCLSCARGRWPAKGRYHPEHRWVSPIGWF